jgi:hypothetical protein
MAIEWPGRNLIDIRIGATLAEIFQCPGNGDRWFNFS